MPTIAAYPTDWSVNQVLTEPALEAQFNHIRDGVNASCLFKDVASQTVSVGVTFTATQVFTPAASVGINDTTGGVTIVGNSTITGTLGGVTTLTCTTVSCTTVTATNLGGTITTAAQTGITSLGTLTALTIAGNLTFSGASRTLIPGTTALIVRNVGDTTDAIKVEATAVTVGGSTFNVRVGTSATLAAAATTGFLIVPVADGPPSGGLADGAIVLDNANNTLVYRINGTWRTLTGA